MKRLISLLLVAMLLLSLSVTAFAAGEHLDESKTQTTIVISADYISGSEGLYQTDVKDNSATVTAGDVSVSVSGVPDWAKVLEVYLVPASQSEALEWMGGKIDKHGTLSHAYIISLVDASGNKTSANGVNVTISCSHCNGNEIVIGLNTNGAATPIDTANGKFTANGSAYYIIAEKKSGTTVTVPVRGDDNEIHADVTITEEDTVELHDLDFEEIDHIVGDHVNTGIVEIDLTGLDDEITRIVLPVTTVEHIVEAAEEAHNDTEALQIDFPSGSVKLDDKTMRAVVEQAECNTVMLVLEEVGESRLNNAQDAAVADWDVYGGYEAYLYCIKGDKRISDFEGGVATLSVPFTVPAGLDADKFSVWYVADDGSTEKLDTHYANGHLVWDVGHFSDFIIVYEGEPPHEHAYTKVVTNPTCTEKGYTTYTCSCGDSYKDDYTDPTGHSFTKYESNNDATCKRDGTETAKCDHGCGKTDTRTDKGSKLGHKYEDGKCVRCGATQWIPETGDKIMVAVVTLIVSGAALLLLLAWKKKKQKQ